MAQFDFQSVLDGIDKDEGEGFAPVPKEFSGLYVKGDDGKFSLNATLAKRLDVSGLKKALDGERGSRKAAEKARTELDGVLAKYREHGETPEALSEKLAELEKRAAGKGDEAGAARWEKARKELGEAHAKVVAEKDGLVSKYKGGMERYVVDSEATKAIAELGGSAKLLLPHVRDHVKVVEEKDGKFSLKVVDAAGDPRVTSSGDMTVADLVKEMSSSADFAMAFKPKGTTGTGAPSGGRQGGKPGDGGGLDSTDKIRRGLAERGLAGR